MSSHQIIQDCIKATETNTERVLKTFSQLSENQFNWKPSSDSWSIGECISHLVNSNKLYLNKIERILKSVSDAEEKDFPYKQSFIGKMIAKGIDPSNVRKIKTFKVFYPDASSISQNIIDNYFKSSENLTQLAKKMKHLNIRKTKLSSPANKLLRMNLGDVLIIISKHDERHLNQAERVMSHKDFPKS